MALAAMTLSGRKPNKPRWLVRRMPRPGKTDEMSGLLSDLSLHTVCEEAHCPNQGECFGRGIATFLLLGPNCTRNCTFCAVEKGGVLPPEITEPERIAEAISRMELTFCVLTMVTRDDLSDGGAGHIVDTIAAIRRKCPEIGIESLISDLQGNPEALTNILNARPEVLNHNIETVPRLYPSVRPMADYRRSLQLLGKANAFDPRPATKSGLMLGLGETKDEILNTMGDLRDVGCDSITLGQYLAPSMQHHPVIRYVPPEEFDDLRRRALSLGFTGVASGPYIRSSFNAEQLYRESSFD